MPVQPLMRKAMRQDAAGAVNVAVTRCQPFSMAEDGRASVSRTVCSAPPPCTTASSRAPLVQRRWELAEK